MTINETIAAIEAKGYTVKAHDNLERGIVNADCPVVYTILNPNWSAVYGAGAVGPDALPMWVATLSDLTIKGTPQTAKVSRTGICPRCHTYCYGDCTASR